MQLIARSRAPLVRTLAGRFLLIVFVSVVIPLGVVGVWLTQSAERTGRSLLHAQLERAADVLSAEVGTRTALRNGELELLANNSATRAMLGAATPTAADSTYLQQLVSALAGSITTASFRDATGEVRWSSDAIAVNAQSRNDSRFSMAPLQDLRFNLSIRSDSVLVGELEVRMRLPAIVPMDSIAALAPGAAMIIRDDRGLLWASSATIPDSAVINSGEWESVRRRLPISSLQMELAAPSAPFVAPFEHATRTGLGVLSLVALSAMVLSSIFTIRLTRSLQELSAAASAVAAGNLDLTVTVKGDDEVGQLAAAFNVMTDSLRRTLAELSHQRSLAAVGEFAASLSHEVRNNLTAIRIDVQHAKRHVTPEHPSAPLLARTLDSVRRLDTMVTSALRVARSGHVTRVATSLPGIVERAILAASGMFAERGAVLEPIVLADRGTDESARKLEVVADAAALEQLFLNVLINAAQAVPAGGRHT